MNLVLFSFYFIFYFFFYFILVVIFTFLYFDINEECEVMSHVTKA